MTLLLLCDVDGTLINTRQLNERAYAEVGISYPAHAWGLTWREWLPDAVNGDTKLVAQVHAAKQNAYTRLIYETDLQQFELTPTAVIRRARHELDASVHYLTAGSSTTARLITERLGVAAPLLGELQLTARLNALRRLTAIHDRRYVYIDDSADTITHVQRSMPRIHTLHFTAQDLTELWTTVSVLA